MRIAVGKLFNRNYRVRCNIGGAAVCKALIASVVLALGVVFLIQEGTNTMVALPGGLRPASAMPTVETVALRKSVTVIRHVAVRLRCQRQRQSPARRGSAARRHQNSSRRSRASRHRGQNPTRRTSTSRRRSPQDPHRSGQARRCGRESGRGPRTAKRWPGFYQRVAQEPQLPWVKDYDHQLNSLAAG